MPKLKQPSLNPDLTDPQYYISRELSWLEFNHRVLHEAMDARTPLLERLKFIAIFSRNLDEYFMVRVAALKQQVAAGVTRLSPDGRTPEEQLKAIVQCLRPMIMEQHHHFEQVLRPQLAKKGIELLEYRNLGERQQQYLQHYFQEQIFPVLTPLAIDPGHPFPHISNLSLNLAVIIRDEESGEERSARVQIPAILPRFIPLPPDLSVKKRNQTVVWAGVPLEQVVAHHLTTLFPGMTIQEYYPFRVTRHADLEVEEDEADDLLLAIEQELRKRRLGGSVVRMEVSASTPELVRHTLMQEMDLHPNDLYDVEGILALGDVMALRDLPLPELKDLPWSPVIPARVRRVGEVKRGEARNEGEVDFFSIVRHQDFLVHHPYDSFSATVQRFLTNAAFDPDVLTIKMTLYRTTDDSPILNALIAAAENGKQVTVLVELKARFDEANNITWARRLEKVGIHVVYGLVGLKTHTKLVLVVRREEERLRRYVHIGTGNYNPTTARFYTDVGLFSSRDELGADLTDLFNYLTGYSHQRHYRKLLVAPMNLRDRMAALIQNEIDHCHAGRHARIVAKMNALVDPVLIKALYEASQAGVRVDLIVRGICCLRPGMKGVSENIRVISIVGRFLEHSRLFYFHNGGAEQVFLGSADWMPRNLDRRVEAIAPIDDPEIAKDVQEILGVILADNRHAWELQPDGQYIQRRSDMAGSEHSSQAMLMQMALDATRAM